ncbi:MAG: hypothetical protein CMP67_07270 [Flavobacteriales bacterium]|nr:hypothetical protein [Flavobacteriales bacterium]MBO72524.1 hypothetical protein [Flavobacteriales bacterium]|tara:strand:- start:228 stop:698 length:471 start_codon:yes stop_codon:yes gene_type:complete
MKKVLPGLFFFLSISLSFSSNDLYKVRELYFKVSLEEEELETFENYLNKKIKTSNPEIEGYKCVLWFLKAKEYYNPYKKYEAFSEGKKQLELLITKNPNSIELRFLRLTIQDNLPGFLGYDDNITEDNKFIKKNIKSLKNDLDLIKRINAYLAQRN